MGSFDPPWSANASGAGPSSGYSPGASVVRETVCREVCHSINYSKGCMFFFGFFPVLFLGVFPVFWGLMVFIGVMVAITVVIITIAP